MSLSQLDKQEDLAKKILNSTSPISLIAYSAIVHRDESLAGQSVANAFLCAAFLSEDSEMQYSALAGLHEVLKRNPAVANCEMTAVVEMFSQSLDENIRHQAGAIQTLTAQRRLDLPLASSVQNEFQELGIVPDFKRSTPGTNPV